MTTTSAPRAALPEPCVVLLSDDVARVIHELSVHGPLCPATIAERTGRCEHDVRARLDELALHGFVRPLETGAYERVRARIKEALTRVERSFLAI